MRKLFTVDDFMVAAVAALGYGFGETIARLSGWPELMCVAASKGSITVGKDADFLVFDNDLLTAEHEGFSYNCPSEVFFGGKKM